MRSLFVLLLCVVPLSCSAECVLKSVMSDAEIRACRDDSSQPVPRKDSGRQDANKLKKDTWNPGDSSRDRRYETERVAVQPTRPSSTYEGQTGDNQRNPNGLTRRPVYNAGLQNAAAAAGGVMDEAVARGTATRDAKLELERRRIDAGLPPSPKTSITCTTFGNTTYCN